MSANPEHKSFKNHSKSFIFTWLFSYTNVSFNDDYVHMRKSVYLFIPLYDVAECSEWKYCIWFCVTLQKWQLMTFPSNIPY